MKDWRIGHWILLGLLVFSVRAPVAMSAEEAATDWAPADETSAQHAARLQWWNSARFGMFVHWGIYSVTGGEYRGQTLPNSAEWMMNRGKIPIAEYEEYAARFNPTEFDAESFVQLAKQAGMRYLVITAKHHDGFAMFESASNPFNVVDATPFKRDIMKELAHACRDQGLRFGFYYSQCQDWHHPGGMGNNWDKTLQRVSFDEYVINKACPEVSQLLTEYGPIGIFWWDTPRDMSRESFDRLHSLTTLQPGIITNDRLGKDHVGDYKTFERQIPRHAPAGQDWEVCMPISGSWGYKRSDTDFKSTTTLIRNLVDIASKGGNYLLNVSPTGEGTLLPQSVERLQAIGRWMKTHSESIYDTTAGPFPSLRWGRCTQKAFANGTTLYLHVFDWPEDGQLVVPGLRNEVIQTSLMADWTALETRSEDAGIVVSLPAEAPDPVDSVVVMQVRGPLVVEQVSRTPNADGSLILSADQAYLHNNEAGKQARIQEHDGIPHVGYWTDAQAWLEWSFRIDRPGDYEVRAELAVEEAQSRFHVGLPGQQVTVEVPSTGGYGTYVRRTLTTLSFGKAGEYTLRVNPDPDHWNPVNLRHLALNRK